MIHRWTAEIQELAPMHPKRKVWSGK